MKRVALFFGLFLFACSSDKSSAPDAGVAIADAATGDAKAPPVSLSDDGGKLSPPASTVSSCDLTTDLGYCLDYGADPGGMMATTNCQSAHDSQGFNGTASETSACPTAGRVGSCAVTLGGVATTYRYYPPKFTTDTAQTDCAGVAGGGTFTPN